MKVLQTNSLYSHSVKDSIFSCAALLQNTLTEFMSTWDNHTVRMSNTHAPTGKPCVLYALPALYNCEDHLSAVDTTDIVLCADECDSKEELHGDNDLSELLHIVMNENGWIMSHDAADMRPWIRNICPYFKFTVCFCIKLHAP